ncbi:MAG: aminopeptidase [Candidatus Hydrogenedentota bacterium]|nr:MAG: aminopeptidase [Candidatus Hydrogenedentota bacterium]
MDPRVKAHAEIIVKYSTRLRPGETVGIYGTTLAEPLVEAVYREALRAGAYPFVRLSIPSLAPFFYRNANEKQLTHLSKLDWAEAREQQARVVILSDANTRALSGVDPKRLAKAARARKPIKDYVINKTRWCLTLHPTEALAQEAEMPLEDYQDFVYAGLFCDKKNPIAEWKKIERMQADLIRKLKGATSVRIVGEETDLSFSIRNRIFVNSIATNNLPSGEIFTAPVETSTEGTIYFDLPTARDGVRVENIRLTFRKGRVVEATAERGEEYLRKMLATDPGASRLGELGIGTNFGIQRATCEILFDEKIGGTVHLALGSAYRECRGKNDSALHWDMIKDLRPSAGRKVGFLEFRWPNGKAKILRPKGKRFVFENP